MKGLSFSLLITNSYSFMFPFRCIKLKKKESIILRIIVRTIFNVVAYNTPTYFKCSTHSKIFRIHIHEKSCFHVRTWFIYSLLSPDLWIIISFLRGYVCQRKHRMTKNKAFWTTFIGKRSGKLSTDKRLVIGMERFQ